MDADNSISDSSSEVQHKCSTSLSQTNVKSYSNQSRCPLFRLPIELRFAIWEDFVGGNHLTVIRKINKLAHVVLPRDRKRLGRAERIGVAPKPGWGPILIGDEKRIKADEVIAQINLLALPQTYISKRVSFAFAIPAVNINQGLQARLYKGGYESPDCCY
ncbi:hypothetical protein F4776DRAFT_266738 [Hypoxylon sp. NC0597]|nr:hypothetical protein F4776DRAFT_266738 [Hypoxylon sp. NC0597]